MQSAGFHRNAIEMENQVFQKAQSAEDYRNLVTKFVLHMQSK